MSAAAISTMRYRSSTRPCGSTSASRARPMAAGTSTAKPTSARGQASAPPRGQHHPQECGEPPERRRAQEEPRARRRPAVNRHAASTATRDRTRHRRAGPRPAGSRRNPPTPTRPPARPPPRPRRRDRRHRKQHRDDHAAQQRGRSRCAAASPLATGHLVGRQAEAPLAPREMTECAVEFGVVEVRPEAVAEIELACRRGSRAGNC